MLIHVTPELGPPPPSPSADRRVYDLPDTIEAGANTARLLVHHGLPSYPLAERDEIAISGLLAAYAADPEVTSKAATPFRIGLMTPAALSHLDAMLKSFGAGVVEDAQQVRNYVTNKLLEESNNPDPRIRIRALELLGKISDVGLFAERSEVTVTHQTSDDLREALRAKLSRLINPDADVIDAEVLEPTPVGDPDALLSLLDRTPQGDR